MSDEFWPNGAACAVAIAVDYDADSIYGGRAHEDRRITDEPRFLGKMSQGQYAGNFAAPEVARILKDHGAAATWFTPAVDAELYPDQIEALVADGFELACHGYTHTAPNQLTPYEEESELVRALEVLHRFQPHIAGYRAPALEPSTVTLDLLAKHGFEYASNLQDHIRPYRHEPSGIIEVPTAWLTNDTVHFWFDGDSWTKKICSTAETRAVWEEEFHGVRAYGGLYVLTVHPMVIGRPSRLQLFDEFVGFLMDQDDVWVATMQSIAAHYAQSAPVAAGVAGADGGSRP